MSNLRDEYLDFKELRESKIKSLIAELNKRNKGISKQHLLKMLSSKERKDFKDANFFQILDFLVDKNINRMTEFEFPISTIADTAYNGAQVDDDLVYSSQTNENNSEDSRELGGGGNNNERLPSFKITLVDEIPSNEEDPFLHRSGMLRIIDEENYIDYLDSEEAYLDNRKNIFFGKKIPSCVNITFNQDYINPSATQHFSYGRFVLGGTYFYGYRTPKQLFLIPMNFGWILLRIKRAKIDLLAYCLKNMDENDCSPVGNTFEEDAVWKGVQLNDGFNIVKSDREHNDNLVKKVPLRNINRNKLDRWQHIPDLPKYITVTLTDHTQIIFTYDRINLSRNKFTYGYKNNNLYIISYNNIFYLFEIDGEFPATLEPKMVIFQSLVSPNPEFNSIGYSLDFEDEDRYEKTPGFDFEFIDVRIGSSVIYHTFNPIVDVDAVSTEVIDYFSSLNEDNLYHLFEMNQCHFEGTPLELIFDNIWESPINGTRGERFVLRKLDFNLSKNVDYKDIYTCYCYVDTGGYWQGENSYIDANNCHFYKFIFLYKQHWVLFKLSDMFRDDRIFIDKATPLYLCPGGSSAANFSYDEWIKLGDHSMGKFQPLHPVDNYGEISAPIRFSYNEVKSDVLHEQLTSDEIIDRHGVERVEMSNNSSEEQRHTEEQGHTDEYIEKLLDSFLKKGDGGNILTDERVPKQNDTLYNLKIFKKDYSNDKNKDFFYLLQYIASIFNFEQNGIGIKNIVEHFDEDIITMILKKTRIHTLTFKDKNDMEMGIDAGGLRPEFFRDIVYEFKKTFLQMISEKDERETKEMAAFLKIERYVEKKLREAIKKSPKSQTRVIRNNTALPNTNNFFRSKKTRNLYQSVIRTKLANNKRRKQEGKPLTKTQKRLIKKTVDKKMEKFNRNVKSLNRKTKKSNKTSQRTLSAPGKVNYGNNKNDFQQICDLEASNFTLRKYKNNSFKKIGVPLNLAYFLGGIFLGKILTNDNGTGVNLQIFPNIQMSYFFLLRLLKNEDYLNSWLDILSVCKIDMPEVYNSFKFWDEEWNDMNYSIWDDDLPIPKEYYKYLGKPKDTNSIRREMKRFGKNERFNSYVPDPKFKLSLFLLYVIEKYERGLEEEYYYFLRGMRKMVNIDLEILKTISSLDKLFTGGTIDVELLISRIQVDNYGHSGVLDEDIDNIQTWLFEMIRELDIAEDSEFLKKLLYFWSSSYNVSESQMYSINVMNKALGDESLVTSHTCSRALDIHKYSSKDIMIEKLRISVLHGQEGFGFA